MTTAQLSNPQDDNRTTQRNSGFPKAAALQHELEKRIADLERLLDENGYNELLIRHEKLHDLVTELEAKVGRMQPIIDVVRTLKNGPLGDTAFRQLRRLERRLAWYESAEAASKLAIDNVNKAD